MPDIGMDGAMRRFLAILKDDRGATAIEYALILAMIFLAMIGAVAALAGTTIAMWDDVSNQVSNT
jgi:pilus assembly protein Flp/PilA